MSAPKPAAVRAALKDCRITSRDVTSAEYTAWEHDLRENADILRDHIRAVAAEMREWASGFTRNAAAALESGNSAESTALNERAADLRRFADRLEGVQP